MSSSPLQKDENVALPLNDQTVDPGKLEGSGLTQEQKLFVLRRLNYVGLQDLDNLPMGAAFMIEKVQDLLAQEALPILQKFLVDSNDDPNVPIADYKLFEELVAEAPTAFSTSLSEKLPAEIEIDKVEPNTTSSFDGLYDGDTHSIVDWDLQVRLEAAIIEFHSPYPEVRSVCEPFDDPDAPCETIRVYIVGLFWLAIGTFIGVFFNDRQPSISLSTSIVQLFIYPLGKLLHYILPRYKFSLLGINIDLNPGPWSYKEQMLATIFYSVSGGYASYVTYNITVQKLPLYYNNDWVTVGYQVLLYLSTNFLGFGLAGIMRKVSVYPTRAVWPTILPSLAINKALMIPEKREIINGWSVSRYSFLFIMTGASFVYYWIPGYLFQALSTFNWMTWIKPDNFNLATITGTVSGLGINPITTFDWNVIDFLSPLILPFYNQINNYVGVILAVFTIMIVFYRNHNWTQYLPINSNQLFNNKGEPYHVRSILNEHSLFDNEKYQKVGPPFYSAANLVSYGAFFAIYPFVVCYVVATDYKFLIDSFRKLSSSIFNWRRSNYEGFNDPHSRMMAKYKEVPEWAFTIVLLLSVMFAILCVKLYPTETGVWTIFFAIALSFIFYIPLTIILSVTGFGIGINVLVEILFGYMQPGNPLGLMFIKALATNIDSQAQNYISSQKTGHYAKISPRLLFRCQMLSLFVASFINIGVLNFVLNNIKDYCDPHNHQKFTCPSSRVFFTSSVIWGVIGPEKIFGRLYPELKYCFLIGLLVSFPCIALKKYLPRKYSRYFQPIIIIGGFLLLPPYNLGYYTPGIMLGYFSMVFLKSRYSAFWDKYNYVFTGGMSAGLAFCSVIIFFAVQYHDKSINWWGNNVMYAGADGAQNALLNATESAPDGYFGPRFGSLP